MDITFKCTQCGQDLEIDESGIGLSVPCPQCNAEVIVPASSRHNTLAATVRLTPFPPLKTEPPAAPKTTPPTQPARSGGEQRLVSKPAAPSFSPPVATRPVTTTVEQPLRTLAKMLRGLAIVVACLSVPAAMLLGPGTGTAQTVIRILVIVDVGVFICLASFGLAGVLDLLLDAAAERNIARRAGQE